jgi:peptide subunit release factor 1 (eRF1)
MGVRAKKANEKWHTVTTSGNEKPYIPKHHRLNRLMEVLNTR